MHAHSATISGHVRTYACGILECRPRYTRDARIALVGRASSQWSFTSPYDYIAPTVTLFSISIQVVN